MLITVEIKIDGEQAELQGHRFVGTQEYLVRRTLELEDDAVRTALMKMGWTPPFSDSDTHHPGWKRLNDTSHYLVDRHGEIKAWVNRSGPNGATWHWEEVTDYRRYFVTLEAAKACVEWTLDPNNRFGNGDVRPRS